jgi:homoserine acetyltransferase
LEELTKCEITPGYLCSEHTATMADYETYKLGNFKLKSGGEIPDAFIAYKTLGDPSLPAIIYPTWYSGCMYPASFLTFHYH